MSDLPVCSCAEFYGSHPPECPARQAYETLKANFREEHEVAKRAVDKIRSDWGAEVSELRAVLSGLVAFVDGSHNDDSYLNSARRLLKRLADQRNER